jgi:hypothetical protein
LATKSNVLAVMPCHIGDVASICVKLNTQTTYVRKGEEKRSLGRSRNRWEDNIKEYVLN